MNLSHLSSHLHEKIFRPEEWPNASPEQHLPIIGSHQMFSIMAGW
ncbi:15619_t:CDS:2 [Funneliformis caledonium]|uniref:15619_t:CDS:1 n=1 Tax=Funneliformis caledonium TaxID=1117310 RepID=A0A9N8WRD4_9GLOM|nr:15619_t:CDS:2 [Funneliformis caledonium]